ncbi:hypothetical protein [Kitasatospora camelliae]|uniref:Uncharacterized protein n=1 Tax=Kitasatospora camelliae TaxID=3156397 RepID=A0AAU8K804_9ACTN
MADFEDEEDYHDAYPEANGSEMQDINAAAHHLSLDPATITADTPPAPTAGSPSPPPAPATTASARHPSCEKKPLRNSAGRRSGTC